MIDLNNEKESSGISDEMNQKNDINTDEMKQPSKHTVVVIGIILAYFFLSGLAANIYFIFIK